MSIKVKVIQGLMGVPVDGQIGRVTFGAMAMRWGLTPIQTAHFLGQCDHETAGFKLSEEDLRYSAHALMRVWPNRYTEELAEKHQFKPSVIANHVYGGRMGNDSPNDGWNYRGRGAIQLTGRDNYQRFSEYIGDKMILERPDTVADYYFFEAGIWYFKSRKLFDLCEDLSEKTITLISKAVNLGNPFSSGTPNGLQDRVNKTIHYKQFIS